MGLSDYFCNSLFLFLLFIFSEDGLPDAFAELGRPHALQQALPVAHDLCVLGWDVGLRLRGRQLALNHGFDLLKAREGRLERARRCVLVIAPVFIIVFVLAAAGELFARRDLQLFDGPL